MSRKGFTLLEVLIVVIIIGILATIALPQYLSTLEKARSAEAMGMLGVLRSSMDRYWFERVAMGSSYVAASFWFGTTGAIRLDVDNPNDPASQTSDKWQYRLVDSSDLTTKSYYAWARRIGKESTHWVQINQDGEVRKSTALGGDDNKF